MPPQPMIPRRTVAGWLAALDGLTPEQRYGVFSSILARPDALKLPEFAETDYTPVLWYLAALPAGRDVRLIGRHHHQAAGRAQRRDRLDHAGQELELFQGVRRKRPAAPDKRPVDHTVAIEEHGRS